MLFVGRRLRDSSTGTTATTRLPGAMDKLMSFKRRAPSGRSKSTALKRVLSHESGHSVRVHQGWPVMMFRRLQYKCLNVDMVLHRDILFKRLCDAGMPPEIVRFAMVRAGRETQRPYRVLSGNTTRGETFWLPLPFHPVWAGCISRALNSINRDKEYRLLLELSNRRQWSKVTVRPAWSNLLTNIANSTRCR